MCFASHHLLSSRGHWFQPPVNAGGPAISPPTHAQAWAWAPAEFAPQRAQSHLPVRVCVRCACWMERGKNPMRQIDCQFYSQTFYQKHTVKLSNAQKCHRHIFSIQHTVQNNTDAVALHDAADMAHICKFITKIGSVAGCHSQAASAVRAESRHHHGFEIFALHRGLPRRGSLRCYLQQLCIENATSCYGLLMSQLLFEPFLWLEGLAGTKGEKQATPVTGSVILRYLNEEAANAAVERLKGHPIQTSSGVTKHLGAKHATPPKWVVQRKAQEDEARNNWNWCGYDICIYLWFKILN